MTDEEFLRALESCTLPEREFGHAAHVRAAYLYLQQGDLPRHYHRFGGRSATTPRTVESLVDRT